MNAKPGMALAALVLCAAIGWILLPKTQIVAPPSVNPAVAAPSSPLNNWAPQAAESLPNQDGTAAPEPAVIKSNTAARAKLAIKAQSAQPGSKKGKDPILDPVARIALAWVGFDQDAEAYWIGAINDPALPAEERQDLIEDLNEDGLSDPKHPTFDDLPIILNRLDLIEALAPDSMDEVNAAAFMEAYKDLVNLAHVSVGEGEPVK